MNQNKRRKSTNKSQPTFQDTVRDYWYASMDQLRSYARNAVMAKLEGESALCCMYSEMAKCEANKASELACWLKSEECDEKSMITSNLIDQMEDMLK